MLTYEQVFATEGVAEGDAAVLVTEIQIDGQRFLQQVGQGLVFAYDAPHEYVGLLRKDGISSSISPSSLRPHTLVAQGPIH
jgi:hypothetical protein